MSFKKSVREAGLGVLSLWLGAAGGVLGLVVMAVQAKWISVPIGIGLGVMVALVIRYHFLRRERDEARRKLAELLEPKAELRYSSSSVRYGSLAAGDEYRHIVDVVNLSRKALTGCRLVLESSDPDEAHVTYPNSPLGDRVGNRDGSFGLNPGDGEKATFQVDVLQQFIRTMNLGSPSGPAEMRYLYADPALNQNLKFFKIKTKNILLRLESADLPTAVWLTLSVTYDEDTHVFTVCQIPRAQSDISFLMNGEES
jgi:hypothetical protein